MHRRRKLTLTGKYLYIDPELYGKNQRKGKVVKIFFNDLREF